MREKPTLKIPNRTNDDSKLGIVRVLSVSLWTETKKNQMVLNSEVERCLIV